MEKKSKDIHVDIKLRDKSQSFIIKELKPLKVSDIYVYKIITPISRISSEIGSDNRVIYNVNGLLFKENETINDTKGNRLGTLRAIWTTDLTNYMLLYDVSGN